MKNQKANLLAAQGVGHDVRSAARNFRFPWPVKSLLYFTGPRFSFFIFPSVFIRVNPWLNKSSHRVFVREPVRLFGVFRGYFRYQVSAFPFDP
jgi:hypothetical protein